MSTQLYFAVSNSDPINKATFALWDWKSRPLNILCPFMPAGGIKSWLSREYKTPGVTTMLDSGAFSAWKSGTEVNLGELIAEAERPGGWDEVAALDVIGDPKASFDNAVAMQLEGLSVIPTFHFGEPWEFLIEYKNQFKKIGLGGIATGISMTQKKKWLAQCFARAYPCKFHGFGVASKSLLLDFPFYSVDTAAWYTGFQYGRSVALPGVQLPKKKNLNEQFSSSAYDYRAELNEYLSMADEVADRWESELSWTK